jgi:hypothetical protein
VQVTWQSNGLHFFHFNSGQAKLLMPMEANIIPLFFAIKLDEFKCQNILMNFVCSLICPKVMLSIQ